jgi:metal-responsive CopG/Arc/MetJ family transcriptional regulator
VLIIPTSEHDDSLRKTVESRKKARISIAIDRDFLVWIDQMIKSGVFANRSHAIHRALIKLKEEVTS